MISYKDLIKELSIKSSLPEEVVELAYKSYWEFIKTKIESLPLKSIDSKEEFDKLRTNFSIPYLGKLVCTFPKLNKRKARFKHIKNIKNNI